MTTETLDAEERERRSMVSMIRMYRGAAKRCGLQLYDIREVNGDGVKYHGFGCHGFTIEFEDWKIVPGRIRHYSGSRYEPPSDEWEPINDAGPFERLADAMRWLLETAHMDALHCALDDAAQWPTFTLRPHDPHAIVALMAYADSVRPTNPLLAEELDALVASALGAKDAK